MVRLPPWYLYPFVGCYYLCSTNHKTQKEMNLKKYLPVSPNKTLISYLLILICFGIFGCAGVKSTIPQERRISLTEVRNNQGDFAHGPLKLKYNFSLTESNMTVTGKISYRNGFDSLDIYILPLDIKGTSLQQKSIYSSGYRAETDRISNRPFETSFPVPAETVAITFTYSVQERSGRRN